MHDTQPLLRRLFALDGKVALVTGAGGGIGRALAQALAEAGATLALHDIAPGPLAALSTAIAGAGGQAHAFTADLDSVTACKQLVADVYTRWDRLDILINCAATNRRKPIAEVSEDDFDLMVGVNLRSILFLCQAAQPLMRDQGGGKIVNIGSLTSLIGLGGVSVYGLTKGGVAQLTKTMAVEWAPDNIQVNCIAPGFMDTPLSQPVWADAHKAAWMLSRIPLRRPGQPTELVGAVLLLCSPASSYITGQTLAVDGGVLAGGSWDHVP